MPDHPDAPDEARENSLVTVFEIVNWTKRERYVGATTLLLPELARRHVAMAPVELAHWDRLDNVSYRSLDYGVPLHDVDDFVQRHIDACAKSEWRSIRQREGPRLIP